MKKLILPIILAFGFLFSSCDESDFEYEDAYNKSLKAYQNFKADANDSYVFTVEGASWVGASWQTTMTVQEGEVVKRYFKSAFWQDGSIVEGQGEEWTENQDELGTHKDTPAYPVATLDEIYDTAKSDWLQKRKKTTTYFETKNNGMISTCGYVEDGCQDDCFRGIYIKTIEALK